MIMKFLARLILLLCLINGTSFSQNTNTIDSLEQLLKQLDTPDPELGKKNNITTDSTKVKVLLELANAFMGRDINQGRIYAEQALIISKNMTMPESLSAGMKGKGWAKGMAKSYNLLSGMAKDGADFESAFLYLDSSLVLARKLSDQKMVAQNKSNRGIIYYEQNLYNEANKLFLESLKIYENEQDTAGIARIYQLQANIEVATGKRAASIELNLKAIDLLKKINNTKNFSGIYSNIGSSYFYLGKSDLSLAYLDTAEQYAIEGRAPRQLGAIFLTKGMVYSEMGNDGEAIRSFRASLDIANEIKNPNNISQAAIALAQGLMKQNRKQKSSSLLKEARQLLNSAFEISQQTSNLENMRDCYLAFSQIDSTENNFRSSLAYFKEYIKLDDSVQTLARGDEILKNNLRYEYDKKEEGLKYEQQRKELISQAKIQQQTIILYAVLGGLVIIVIFVIILIKRIAENKKANAELKKAMEELKHTQEQLVESEKMAAFGILASRVAHEVLNPLNFVNNFSEISKGLANDLTQAHDENEKKLLTNLLNANLDKIIHHGERAQAIIDDLQKHVDSGTAHEFFKS